MLFVTHVMVGEPLITYPSSQITSMDFLGCTGWLSMVNRFPFFMVGTGHGFALQVGTGGS